MLYFLVRAGRCCVFCSDLPVPISGDASTPRMAPGECKLYHSQEWLPRRASSICLLIFEPPGRVVLFLYVAFRVRFPLAALCFSLGVSNSPCVGQSFFLDEGAVHMPRVRPWRGSGSLGATGRLAFHCGAFCAGVRSVGILFSSGQVAALMILQSRTPKPPAILLLIP